MCPLCLSESEPLEERYRHCLHCDFRFMTPKHQLSPENETKEYLRLENDLEDLRYRSFLQPIADRVIAEVTQGTAGLDFGAGPGPLLARMLEEQGYPVTLYDPLFFPNQSALQKKYEWVTASEVVEHFRNPRAEFEKLRDLLAPKGKLILMTLLYHPGIEFRTWHYRREKAHVGFYSRQSCEWIRKWAGFSEMEITGERVIVFRR